MTLKWNRWVLVAVWMGVIWWFSDQPGLSSGLAYDFWLRKAAHVAEYAVLAVLFGRAMELPDRRRVFWLAFSLAIAYAALDEWHQTWVPGREGALRDVLIDAAGAAAGAWLTKTPPRAGE